MRGEGLLERALAATPSGVTIAHVTRPDGLARAELVLHYQPKLDLAADRVAGVEALVRWQHPERGLLYPDAFIDLAESFGLMAGLTAHVLDLALEQCPAGPTAGSSSASP